MVYDNEVDIDWKRYIGSNIDKSPLYTTKLCLIYERSEKNRIVVEIA